MGIHPHVALIARGTVSALRKAAIVTVRSARTIIRHAHVVNNAVTVVSVRLTVEIATRRKSKIIMRIALLRRQDHLYQLRLAGNWLKASLLHTLVNLQLTSAWHFPLWYQAFRICRIPWSPPQPLQLSWPLQQPRSLYEAFYCAE